VANAARVFSCVQVAPSDVRYGPAHEESLMRRFAILLMGIAMAAIQVFWPGNACAQDPDTATQHLSGTVKDALGRPLPGVVVSLQDARSVSEK
jgi:hypothetical protein